MAEKCIAGVPAYFYPWPASLWWKQFAELGPGNVIVANPASGPGQAVDTRYADVLDEVHSRGVVVLGYVDSDYGAIDLDRIADETARHRSWYPINGIFVDRVAPDGGSLPYYTQIAQRVHDAGLSVAFNAGQPYVDARYAEVADQLVVFEGPLTTYLETQFPDWSHVASNRLWHLVYGVATAEEMRGVVARAVANNAGIVYVTDGIMPNPWDRLPPYWDAEQQLLDAGSPRG